MLGGKTSSSRKPQPVIEPAGSGRVLWAYLIVQLSLFAGLAWKWRFFEMADLVYHTIPLDDPFFPGLLQSADVVRWCYLGTLASIIVGVLGMLPWIRSLSGAVLVACLAIMLVHQASHNDMTFATGLWVAVWSFWFTTRMARDEPYALLERAAFLSRAIGSMVLLGGAVGKWTPEYWSGDVFYDIYFVDRDYWVFNYLRETYETETLKTMAMWYSRKVVVVETLAGFLLWLMPARLAAVTGMLIFFSIAFFSNYLLFSVLMQMIGLMAVGLFTHRVRKT